MATFTGEVTDGVKVGDSYDVIIYRFTRRAKSPTQTRRTVSWTNREADSSYVDTDPWRSKPRCTDVTQGL